jgi:GntR family transcriptional regulator
MHNPLFHISPSSGVPIYRQLIDQVKSLVASGRLRPGDSLPSVRQLAAELSINMMTVSKAYGKLEADGLVTRDRGQGMRIAESSTSEPLDQRLEQLRPTAEQLVVQSRQLQLTNQQALQIVREVQRSFSPTNGSVTSRSHNGSD